MSVDLIKTRASSEYCNMPEKIMLKEPDISHPDSYHSSNGMKK